MLDTNTVAYLLRPRKYPQVRERLAALAPVETCISVVTEGELLYGLARRPEARALHVLVHGFLATVPVVPLISAVAGTYGRLRADCEMGGVTISPLDLWIAAHAATLDHVEETILVTHDRVFARIEPPIRLVDWV